MICATSSSSGAERFGGKLRALFVLVSPALLWAGQYIREPELHRYYEHLLNFLPIGAPSLALYWFAAMLRLLWPERLPGTLPRGSTHMRHAVQLGRGLFWAAAASFVGAMLISFLGWTGNGAHGNPLAFVTCVCLGVGSAVREYVKFRTEPGTRVEQLIEPSMLVMWVPILILLGMMLIVSIASWNQPGLVVALGGLFLAVLWAYVRLVKKTLARRRELRALDAQAGASSPAA